MSSQQTIPHSNVKTYLWVFIGLACLTGLTVSLSYLNLPHHVGIAFAALISLAKCALIARFFMHLKSEKWGVTAFLLTGLAFVIVLIAAILPDIGIVHP